MKIIANIFAYLAIMQKEMVQPSIRSKYNMFVTWRQPPSPLIFTHYGLVMREKKGGFVYSSFLFRFPSVSLSLNVSILIWISISIFKFKKKYLLLVQLIKENRG